MTLVGAITLLGLVLTYVGTRPGKIASCVREAWWMVFLLLVWATVLWGWQHSNAPLLYGVGSMVALSWFCLTFSLRRSVASYTFGVIFIVNATLNWVGVDQYKIYATVDWLDLGVWAQIALLWQLRRENPEFSIDPRPVPEEDPPPPQGTHRGSCRHPRLPDERHEQPPPQRP